MNLLLAAVVSVSGFLVHSGDAKHRYGQLCPISPEIAYTAAHVLREANEPWWEGKMAQGRLEILYLDTETDVARVKVVGAQFPEWYVVGKVQPGDEVYWRGESWYAKNWYIDRGLWYGEDEYGWIEFGHGSHPGMSGGCVFNAKHEVVAVLSGSIGLKFIPQGTPVSTFGFALPVKEKKAPTNKQVLPE